jgi:2-polyprenyl-3-methyl-5-hydroxy-6-metoxy-1,4-benzoquinol methylase
MGQGTITQICAEAVRNWLLTTEVKPAETYRSLPICADLGLHEQMLGLFQKHAASGGRVLDVGAGSGAFSLRLRDHGFQPSAIDIDENNWRAEGIPFLRLDAERGLAASVGEQFDAVCCQEVMEHVENPWQLARELYAVLRPGGVALISTPNVGSFLSRAQFLRRGQFHQFQLGDQRYGHIRPITDLEMQTLLCRAGFAIREVVPGGYLPVFDLSSWRPRALAANLLRGAAYVAARGAKWGWVLIFVVEKPTDRSASSSAEG